MSRLGGFKNFIRGTFNIYTGGTGRVVLVIRRANILELIRHHEGDHGIEITRRRIVEEMVEARKDGNVGSRRR